MVKVYPICTTTTVFSYSIIKPIYKEADIASVPPRLWVGYRLIPQTVTLVNSKQIPHKSPYTASIVQSSAHCQGLSQALSATCRHLGIPSEGPWLPTKYVICLPEHKHQKAFFAQYSLYAPNLLYSAFSIRVYTNYINIPLHYLRIIFKAGISTPYRGS